MKYTDVVSNVNVYGMDSAVMGSKYPMAVDLTKVDGTIVPRTHALASAKPGSGHDNFLNGIIVQFDLTFTNKAWVEAERYHFLDFISSQSTMHRITKFNLDEVYISYTDPRIIEIMKEKVNSYNELTQKISDKKLAGEVFNKDSDTLNYLVCSMQNNEFNYSIGKYSKNHDSERYDISSFICKI